MSKAPEVSQDKPTLDRWLSSGVEDLIWELDRKRAAPALKPNSPDDCDFDVIIVGSGYGGAIAAAKLSEHDDPTLGRRPRICVLERGREYLSGMFPISEAQLPGHVRFNTSDNVAARGRQDALLDLRIGPDVNTLVANGLGGGSLINAGVMVRATPSVLRSKAWPASFQVAPVLDDFYTRAEELLAPVAGQRLPSFDDVDDPPQKLVALRAFGKGATRAAPLSISIKGGRNAADIDVRACIRCGDCATGCNHQAKNSLDQNCLVLAARNGVQIVCGATATHVSREDQLWCVHVQATDDQLRDRIGPRTLTAKQVILAAGSFGSTEILKRSQTTSLKFSSKLGTQFSTNGDLLAVSFNEAKRVNAVADETQTFETRNIGPTITGMIDQRASQSGIVIEEFAIPGALRRIFEESFTLAGTFSTLGHPDPERQHRSGTHGTEPCGVDARGIAHTQVFGVMGHDGAAGSIELVPGSTPKTGNGAMKVQWPEIRAMSGTVFDSQVESLERLSRKARVGGRIMPNPIWRLMPAELESIVSIPRGPALTVHPLGGCPMGDDASVGVVDDYGGVFDASDSEQLDRRHAGLWVLDGSIIPTSLGINPALTIAAVTLRSIERMTQQGSKLPTEAPPHFASLPPPARMKPASDIPTKIQVLERVTGIVEFSGNGDATPQKRMVELTLAFEPASLRDLSRNLDRKLDVDRRRSKMRVFEIECWHSLWETGASEQQFEQCALFSSSISGGMTLLDRGDSSHWGRVGRGLCAWWLNRGARDLWQRWIRREDPGPKSKSGPLRKLCTFLNFASHAGEERLFTYRLFIDTPHVAAGQEAEFSALKPGAQIRTVKNFTYARRSNPWRQLSQMSVEAMPGMQVGATAVPVLSLEPKFFARHQQHLMSLTQQRDHATALFDMASFLLTILRLLLTVHLWSFRQPDASANRKPKRLAGRVAGLPAPEHHNVTVGARADGRPVNILLTRYPKPGTPEAPVALIHGFSANGTTFAHESLRPGLAKYLWDRGRDIWIVDLRTSSGLDTARNHWKFEDVAWIDIPYAIERITTETRAPKIDIVAHCMGAAMLCMAILDPGPRDASKEQARDRFRDRIGRIVLSQISPMVVFSPENIFRGYSVNYVQQAIGDVNFELRPEVPALADELLDRLLATIPYPSDAEFDAENPRLPWKRTPWVSTRHRMDAWFGRVFNANNLSTEVLEHIDDMFGPINLKTTFQTIHFARQGVITSHLGHNIFVDRQRLARWEKLPTLSIHGECNGLADSATLTRMRGLMHAIKAKHFAYLPVAGFGHQDCMIGKDAADKVFPHIAEFLTNGELYQTVQMERPKCGSTTVMDDERVAVAPWIGPLLGKRLSSSTWQIAIASDPKIGEPGSLLAVPVIKNGENWQLDSDDPRPLRAIHFGIDNAIGAKDELPAGATRWYVADVSLNAPPQCTLILLIYDQYPLLRLPPWTNLSDRRNRLRPLSLDLGAELGEAFESFLLRGLVDAFLRECSADELEAALLPMPTTSYVDASDTACFAVGSCQYVAGPLDEQLAFSSYRRLAELINTSSTSLQPSVLLLTGDQVYTDATAGLIDPASKDDRYEVPYMKWMRAPAVRAVLKRLPAFMLIDDHEITENWDRGSSIDPTFGIESYIRFQRVLEPVTVRERLWFTKQLHGFHFFFCDTRTWRDRRSLSNLSDASIMTVAQFNELEDFLQHRPDPNVPLFVVTPSIVLPRRVSSAESPAGALRSDAWDGYPNSLNRLLTFIATNRIQNVVFLSGDEHHSCVAKITLREYAADGKTLEPPTIAHSVHCSALYAPFVFANGDKTELKAIDQFDITDHRATGRTVRCDVTTQFIDDSDSSFALIRCDKQADARWSVTAIFHLQRSMENHRPPVTIALTPDFGIQD